MIYKVLTFLLLFVSCTQNADYKTFTFTEQKIVNSKNSLKIPSSLWDELNLVYNETMDEQKRIKDSSGIAKNFSSPTVYLIEKSHGILGGQNFRLVFPKEGGTLDLSDYVKNRPGVFYLTFEWPEEKDYMNKKIFFLNGAKKRPLFSSWGGAACNEFFNITSFLKKEMMGSGLYLSTVQQAHLSLLMGSYVFAARSNKSLLLSQITISDSRFPNLSCTY